jgi:hypothetical protein
MNLVDNIKDLGVSLEDLYEGKGQINIKMSDNPNNFWVVLKDRKGPDCKISSFGANIWTRTNKGENYEKYSNFATLQTAIKNRINKTIQNVGKIQFFLETETIMPI